MTTTLTPRLIGRRSLGFLAASLAACAEEAALAQSPGAAATPRQTAGPFYPVDWTGDSDGDLVRVEGAAARARGVVMHLRGRVLDPRGAPVPGAVVEIWQCDASGLYRHPRDREGTRDAGFQGRGRVTADDGGGFSFRTIRPVAYPGRTPHIHALIRAPGRRDPLVTQFYVAGEPLNARDGLFNAIRDPRQRDAVLLRPEPADGVEPGALLAFRDVVLG